MNKTLEYDIYGVGRGQEPATHLGILWMSRGDITPLAGNQAKGEGEVLLMTTYSDSSQPSSNLNKG